MERENAFGRLVHALRESEQMSRAQLAKQLGVSEAYVCGLEKGSENPPHFKRVEMLHKVFARRVTFANLAELVWIEKAPKAIRQRLREKCRNPLYDFKLTAPKIQIPKGA